MDKDELFMKQLMETFKIEADEHLKAAALLLVQLEESHHSPEDKANIEIVFREIHSLKGAARAVNLSSVELICQSMESVLSLLKKQTMDFSSEQFDVFQDGIDYLVRLIDSLGTDAPIDDAEGQKHLILRIDALKHSAHESMDKALGKDDPEGDDLTRHTYKPKEKAVGREAAEASVGPKCEDMGQKASAAGPAPTLPVKPVKNEPYGISTGTQRVSSDRLTSVLLQVEEMISLKLSSHEQLKAIKGVVGGFSEWKKKRSQIANVLRELQGSIQGANCLDDETGRERFYEAVHKTLDWVQWNNAFVEITESRLKEIEKSSQCDFLTMQNRIDTLQEEMKKVTMYPFSSILDIFPKMVRDLANAKGRNVNVEIFGADIEIDRRILEEMHDPLNHMVRNAIDHGIESAEERKQLGKTAQGRIRIEVLPQDSMVEVVVSDNGRGISKEKLKEALRKSGLQSKNQVESLSTSELESFVFHSGVSTSPIITEISGRGLGLAIVKEKVEKLGGRIEIKSEERVGTAFHMLLPLTVATFRGLLITVGGQKFILPTMFVKRVLRANLSDIQSIENKATFFMEGRGISLVELSSALGIQAKQGMASDFLQLIIMTINSKWLAFHVDEIQQEQEVLFKDLGPQLIKVRNIAGATVMGSGEVVPILNAMDLFDTFSKGTDYSSLVNLSSSIGKLNEDAMAVLVAEDSITTRTLLKNLLESSGYTVETAINGVDALAKINSRHFDILLSDVDMPQMGGFELTKQIRENEKTKNLPVILITALASKEDKERGIDVGANAYIVKESFDQRNLLDVMKRLMPREGAL